eukprot:3434641-Pleurochrysis_carterae.AAC.1
MADDDLRIFKEKFKLTVQTKPRQFLGMNIDSMDAQGGVKISAKTNLYVFTRPVCPRETEPPSTRQSACYNIVFTLQIATNCVRFAPCCV